MQARAVPGRILPEQAARAVLPSPDRRPLGAIRLQDRRCLFVLGDHCRLVVNFRFRIVQVLAVNTPASAGRRVGVKLLLLQVVFALQNVEFVRIVREFLVRVGKFAPPVGFILYRRLLSRGAVFGVFSPSAFLAWSSGGAGSSPTTLMVPFSVPRLSLSIVILAFGAFFFASWALRAASATLS